MLLAFSRIRRIALNSKFLLADCLSVVFLGFASQGCTAHWNGLLQGFADKWALRSSQHIISQCITSHNHIASHHVISLYITSITLHDSTSITLHHITSHDMTAHAITSHHIISPRNQPHYLTSLHNQPHYLISPRNQPHDIIPHHITAHHITRHSMETQPATTKTSPPNGTAEGWCAQKTRFGQRTGWWPCAYFIRKVFLWLTGFLPP